MRNALSNYRLPALVAPALLLGLSGCELRKADEGAESPEPPIATSPAEGAVLPDAGEAEPGTSIIREDIATEEPPQPVAERVHLTIPFPDGSDLSDASAAQLKQLLDSPAIAQGWPVLLGGHTDSSGFDQANLRASRARAEAVAAWLVERGVADERIEVIAFGEQNPIAPNALPDGSPNEEGRRANRRVEVIVAPRETGGEKVSQENSASSNI